MFSKWGKKLINIHSYIFREVARILQNECLISKQRINCIATMHLLLENLTIYVVKGIDNHS